MQEPSEDEKDFIVLKNKADDIHRYLRDDDNPQGKDLKDILGRQCALKGNMKYHMRDFGNFLPLQISEKKFISFPVAIEEAFAAGDICASFLGVIPEINRVWVTVDNVIYFWNYMDESGLDVIRYEGFSEVVYSVTLATPKPETFTDSVAYLLVVCTPVEVCLLAVVRDDQIEYDIDMFHLATIQPTRYSTPSDNLTFVSIVGTATGRIFMAASDNYMYEFQYSNEESTWMNYLGIGADFRCKKQRVDMKWLSTLTSVFGNGGDCLVDLVVDNPRQLLYAVSKNGKLSAFRLDNDNIFPITLDWNIVDKAKAKGMAVNVYVVSIEESAQLHGVVVLSSGVRIYFQVLASAGVPYCPQRTTTPVTLDVACVRQPPKDTHRHDQDKEIDTASSDLTNNVVYKSFYSHGTYFAATRKDRSEYRLMSTKMERITTKDGNSEVKEIFCLLYKEEEERGLEHGQERRPFNSKVEDIKEISRTLYDTEHSKICRLYYASKTPDQDTHSTSKGKQPTGKYLESIPGPGYALPFNKRPFMTGYMVERSEDSQYMNKMTDLAAQMIPTYACSQRSFLVLSRDGLRLVSQQRPVDYLYTLMEYSDFNQRQDLEVIKTKIFDYYGETETTTMCLSLACNLPADAGSWYGGQFHPQPKADPRQIESRVISIIRNFRMLEPEAIPFGIGISRYNQSHFCRAVHILFSRIVRPIWFREPVQVDRERRDKFVHLLKDKELDMIIRPLQFLRKFFMKHLSTAIQTKELPQHSVLPGANPQRVEQARAQDEDYQHQNYFYRILSRTIHALNVLKILQWAKNERRLDVKWSELADGKTFFQLVVYRSCHDTIKEVLRKVVCNQGSGVDTTEITKFLEDKCFHYFSAGDVHLHEGNELLKTALSHPKGSPAREKSTIKAVEKLCEAAKYWSHMNDIENLSSPSRLTEMCEELVKLDEMGREGVVRLCLATAENFGGGNEVRSLSFHASKGSKENWIKSLYHSGSVVAENDKEKAKKMCYQTILNTLKKLMTDWHQNLIGRGVFRHDDLQSEEDIYLRNILNFSLIRAKDEVFHTMLYDFLLDNDMKLYLLDLDTDYIENYLRERDPNDFYEYLWRHEKFYPATELMARLAQNGEKIEIIHRIEYFTKAVASAVQACRSIDVRAMKKMGHSHAAELHKDMNDKKELAEFQHKLVKILKYHQRFEEDRALRGNADPQQDAALKELEKLVHKGTYELLDLDFMYSKVSEPLKFWELSLEILHISGHDREDDVNRLWKSILYSLIPRSYRSEYYARFLEQFKEEADTCNSRPVLIGDVEDFDSYKSKLEEKIVDLGKVLKGNEGGLAFPRKLLILDLEKLLLKIDHEGNWLVDCLIDIDIPFQTIIDDYVDLIRRHDNRTYVGKMASSVAYLVVRWIQESERNDQYGQHQRNALQNSIRSSLVRRALDSVRNRLNEVLNLGHHLPDDLTQHLALKGKEAINEAIKGIDTFASYFK